MTDILHITDRERTQAAVILALESARDEMAKRIEALTAAADYVVRRLSVDIDDGGRPDHWSMEDMVRMLKAAMPAAPQDKP